MSRALSHFMERQASGDESDPKMEGYLEKKRKSRLVSLWHRYWFVLDGAHLLYYENRPSSPATPCKGAVTLTPTTSVTASSPTRCPSALHSHLSNYEIYIFTPSKLVTLRTREMNDHKIWMSALLQQAALLAKQQNKGQMSVLSPRNTVAGPFQSSHIHYRHSLTSLIAIEEKDNICPLKISHTMERTDPNTSKFKSGSTGSIIAKHIIKDNAVIDVDTSSEEEDALDKAHATGFSEVTGWSRNRDHSSNPKIPDKEDNIAEVFGDKFSESENYINVADSEEISSDKQFMRSGDTENKLDSDRDMQLQDTKLTQTQEHKIISRKLFGRKELKTNSMQTSCKKVYKKCRDTVSSDRAIATSKPFLQIEDEQKQKLEEYHPKDNARFKKQISILKRSDSSNDYKVPIDNSLPSPSYESSLPPKHEGMKSSNKAKMKKSKNKKDRKNNPPSYEVESNRKSKLTKTNDALEDGDTKTKVKKIGFFSKLVKGKKNETQEDKHETMEESQKPESYKELAVPDDDPSKAKLKGNSSEERRLHVTSQRSHFGLKLISTDDAEFQKKLQSRMLKMEADQETSTEISITANAKRKLPVPVPRKKDEDMELSSPVLDGHDEMIPMIPPRIHQHAPTLPERTNNSPPLVPPRKSEKLPLLHSKPKITPKFNEKYEIPEVEMKNNYDKVKFKVKNIESDLEKSAINYSFGINDESQIVVINEPVLFPDASINSSETYNENANTEVDGSSMDGKEVDNMNVNIHFEKENDVLMGSPVAFTDMSSYEVTHRHNETDLRNAPSSSSPIQTLNPYSSSKVDEKIFHKIDQLDFFLSELDRINSSPLENVDSGGNQTHVAEDIKRISSDREEFLEAYPIRRRRNSDPDYDIPRPHRLPKNHQVSVDSDKNPSSENDNESRNRETTDSIMIEATCFLGPGMDQSFNENRYYGLNNKDWNDKCDEIKNCFGDKSSEGDERDSFRGNSSVNLDYYSGVYNEESTVEKHDSDSRAGENFSDDTSKSHPVVRQDSEVSVHLRIGNIDRACRSERSREVHESDIEDFLNLTESMGGLSISRKLEDEHSMKTSNPENDSSLQVDVSNDDFEEESFIKNYIEEFTKEDYVSRVDEAQEQFEESESIINANDEVEDLFSSANYMREPQEIQAELEKERPDLFLRHLPGANRSDIRENKTIRLSFATTETLIVEEEVLVASLKTTTTTAFSTSTGDLTSSEKREKVEELVEEVVLDMDKISDDHFGSMQIQSCVQT